MIPQDLLPPAMRTAPVEEQLSYLLQRRLMILKLMRALEAYAEESDETTGAAQRRPGPLAA